MRFVACFMLAVAAACAYASWLMLGIDLSAYNSDQRLALQLAFDFTAFMVIAGPILAGIALHDDAKARRRNRRPARSRAYRRSPR